MEGKKMVQSKLGSNRPLTAVLVVAVLLFFDMSALAMPSTGERESIEVDNQATQAILVDGIPPLMCGESPCNTPDRVLDRGDRFSQESYGWWLSYGPDKDWNGMDDRLQMIMSGQFESESPTAILGSDGRLTVAITVDFAWHPGKGELNSLRAVLEAHDWVGEEGGAWWKPMTYLDAVAVDKVPVSALLDIWAIHGVVVVEMQNVLVPFLDTATPSALLRDSDEYTNEVHERGYRGDGVVVAVLDTGVDNEHRSLNDFDDIDDEPDFDADSYSDQKWVGGYDATSSASRTDGTEDPNDGQGHGSHCAGIALGTGDSSRIHMGAAPGSYLVDIKVLTDAGGTNSQYSYNGIEWMIQNKDKDWGNNDSSEGIQVASLSFGTFSSPVNNDDTGGNGSSAEARLVNRGMEEGIVMVVAMGNDGAHRVPSPANADYAISVAAANNRNSIDRSDDTVASYSNSGPREDDGDDDEWDELKPVVTAPGSGINSVSANTAAGTPFTEAGKADSDYEEKDGTSMSTPLVAGIAAVMISADPDLDPFEIKDIIQNNSQQMASSDSDVSDRWNSEWGFGLANAACYIDTILEIPCDGDPSSSGTGGGGGGDDPPPTSNGTGDVLEILSPSPSTWFVVGRTNRISGTLDTDGNRTWDHVEARVIRESDILQEWTRAGGMDDWFIDLSAKDDWVEEGESAWIEVRAIDDTSTPSSSEFLVINAGRHKITFTSPSGHDSMQGIENIGGAWEGIDAKEVQLRVDSGDWETIVSVASGEDGYESGKTWSYSWDSTVIDDGMHRLTVRLVNESGLLSDEIRRTFNIDNDPPAPDFEIQGGVQILHNGLPAEGAYVQSTIEVHVDVVNNGDKDSDEVIVSLSPAGGQILEQIIPEMRQGEVHTVIFWNWMPESVGLTDVTLTIDPGNSHGDINRENNEYSFSFDVYERPNEVDIQVRAEAVSTTPRIPSVGEQFDIVARIENVGQISSANVTIYLEEFVEGAGWQEVSNSRSEIQVIPGSTISTSYEIYKTTVPESSGIVRQFRITALQDDSIIENEKTNNFAVFNVIFDNLELVGSGTQLSISTGETPLGYAGVGESGHLLTTRDGELHLRTISESFTMPGDTTIETDFAGNAAIISADDGTSYITWTRRFQSPEGYTLHDVAFVTVDERGKKSQTLSMTTPLKISEGSYWGLDMDFRDDLLVIAGFHRDIATAGSYQDITNLFTLSTTNPSSSSDWVYTPGFIDNVEISSHQGNAPSIAVGKERVHILYEAIRDDTTGISRIGMFYANGVIGQSALSIQTGVGDNASMPNIEVSVIDGDDVVMAAWREESGPEATLVYAITDSSWSIEEPERYLCPGMTSIHFISDGDGVQVLFDKVGFQGPEIHYGIINPTESGFSASLEEGYLFSGANVDGDTHFLYWSKGGGFYVHNLVDPLSGNNDDDGRMSFLDRILEPIPGDRDTKIKIASGIGGLIFILLLVVTLIIRRGRKKEIEFIEQGGEFIEPKDSDIELVEEEIKVAIDLDAEVVEVSVPEAELQEPTLVDTLKEAAQDDTAGVRLRRRMDRIEKAEQDEIISQLPPPIFDGVDLPELSLPDISGLPPTISLEQLPPLAELPKPSNVDLERHAECSSCGAHFTVKNDTLKQMPCPMCNKMMEL